MRTKRKHASSLIEQPKVKANPYHLTPEDYFDYDAGHPILDSIADGVFTVDQNYRITSFNRAAEEITGYSRQQAIGRPCYEIFRANICESECALRRTIETRGKLVNVPIEIENRLGHRVPISVSTAILHDRLGHQIGGVETFRDMTALNELKRQLDEHAGLDEVIGGHPKMKEILEILPEVARSDATVLIQGASGTGKGLLAQTLHKLSPRANKPFIKLNCAALPETLLESELFGYQKGAFTDAKKNKPGRIALAQGGSLFLDEIGDISITMQVKLLRVVQDREYEPLGATNTYHADVRIIAATNQDLAKLMAMGKFREDLFYRLNIIDFYLPTLAERREDIPRLVNRILNRLNQKMGKNVSGLSEGATLLLQAHDYPGNVRELENAIEHALVLCRGSILEEKHLPETIRKNSNQHSTPQYADSLVEAEAKTIKATLERFEGNRAETAKALGLHRTSLWRKMKRYDLV